jgi:hypothetical protein
MRGVRFPERSGRSVRSVREALVVVHGGLVRAMQRVVRAVRSGHLSLPLPDGVA